jgi:hypothetical protein
MAQDLGREEAITHIFCLLGNLALERQLLGQVWTHFLYTTTKLILLDLVDPVDYRI